MPDIHHAKPGSRRRLIFYLVVATALGSALFFAVQAYQPALIAWVESDPSKLRSRLQLLIAIAGALVILPLVGFAAYVWRIGSRTLRQGRFPPEGLAVIQDVPIVHGAEAQARGRVFYVIATIILAAAAVLTALLVRIAQ